jgi:hypothetical protein
MSKSLDERVNRAFTDADSDKAQKFLDVTLSSWQQISDTITRTVVAIFFLGAVFELLVGSANASSLTLGPLAFHNTALLQQFMPPLIAYLVYDTFSLVGRYIRLAGIYYLVLEKYQPKLRDSGLVFFVQPQLRGPWAFQHERPPSGEQSKGENFDDIVSQAISYVAFFLLPLAFEAQAYYVLFGKYGLSSIPVWVSLIITFSFLIVWLTNVALREWG